MASKNGYGKSKALRRVLRSAIVVCIGKREAENSVWGVEKNYSSSNILRLRVHGTIFSTEGSFGFFPYTDIKSRKSGVS